MWIRLSPGESRPVAAVMLAGASLVAAAAVGSIFLSSAHDAWGAIAADGPAGPADGILLMTSLGGVLLSLWVGLGMTLSALSTLPGALGQVSRRLAGRVAPAAVRKAVAFLLGTTLTAALIPGTALAGTDHHAPRPVVVAAATHPRIGVAVAAPDASFRLISDPAQGGHDTDAAPPPSWLPDRSASGATNAAQARPTSGAEGVVVLRGDTLWSIAAHHLGAAATAADIEAEWPRWLATNRGVIGDDANLILPGQLLRPPPSRAQS